MKKVKERVDEQAEQAIQFAAIRRFIYLITPVSPGNTKDRILIHHCA
ncbi:MAG: hypothetical protein WDM70_06265 [Nitrosomonadales bacterium]